MTLAIDITSAIDLVIAFTVIECAALIVFNHVTGDGISVRDFAANLVSGLCLMFALRCAVAHAGAGWIAVSLAAAGLAHISDLWMRWRRRPGREQRALVS